MRNQNTIHVILYILKALVLLSESGPNAYTDYGDYAYRGNTASGANIFQKTASQYFSADRYIYY